MELAMTEPITGHIFCFVTAAKVTTGKDGRSDVPDAEIESGFIDPLYSMYILFESRNDVRPVLNMSINDPGLADEIKDLIREWSPMADNGDGTFICQYERDIEDGSNLRYSLHFSHKYLAENGFTETPWHPVRDGGIQF